MPGGSFKAEDQVLVVNNLFNTRWAGWVASNSASLLLADTSKNTYVSDPVK